ncbi:serine/threonine protein kinase [Corallococcus sp. H22C18031201]|nr:serine/threonine protein kinase [Corallococcus sp. H22C18031201]
MGADSRDVRALQACYRRAPFRAPRALEGFPIDFHRGERIGKYEVLTQLSVGGMAELFLGYTSGPGGFRKYVVIKRILPDARENAQFKRMFLDEARITAAFNHPNIAQVFDLGEEDDGLYLAMEFIAGQNLNQVTSACLRKRQQVPLAFTLSVARDVCLALHYAHAFTTPGGEPSPVIHRDVAQKNIMVTYDGVVKLLDFGIAKAKGSLERTHVGTVKGTTGYMSPEQVRGESLDGRSDLFSVGVVLHELVTGARLFAGRTERDEMVKILEDTIPWPSVLVPHVSEDVSRAIMKALERGVSRRYPNGRDMARAIEKAAGKQLMDADQRAALMRDLFAERLAATRALLESVDASTSDVVLESARRALQKDEGPYLPERKDAMRVIEERKKAEAAAARAADTDPVRQDPVPIPPRQKKQKSGSSWIWTVLVLALLGGSGYGVFLFLKALDASATPEQPQDPLAVPIPANGANPRLAVFHEPGSLLPDAGMAKATKVEPPPAKENTKEKEPEEAPDEGRNARRAEGKLTLVVLPEADVYRGKKKLGRTPLFNVPIPVGTHVLRIVGPDKKERTLTVPVQVGKPAVFKLALQNIPEG